MELKIRGKTAVVTGGSRGLGRAMARRSVPVRNRPSMKP